MRYIVPIEQVPAADLADLFIHLRTGIGQVGAARNHHQHAAAGGHQGVIAPGGAHVIHAAFNGIQSLNRKALFVLAGIALGSQHHAQSHPFGPARLIRRNTRGNRIKDIKNITLEQRQHNLRLGIAEAGVELYHLDAVRRLHQPAVEHAAKRNSLRDHGGCGLAHYLPIGELLILRSDERQPGVGAHPPGIRSLVAVESALVVLRERHGIHALPVNEAEERKLRAGKEILHHHPAFAEALVQQHIGKSLTSLLHILSYHHPLAGGKPVVLQHRRERTAGDVLQRFLIIRKTAIRGGRDAIFEHQFLGELLGTLDGRCRLGMPENLQPGSAESIHYAGGQRSLGAHHRQIHRILQREGLKSLNVSIFQGHIERQLPYSGIARSAVNLGHLRRTRQSIHYSMLTSAAADNQNGFAQNVLQVDFFRTFCGLQGGKRINKAHIF